MFLGGTTLRGTKNEVYVMIKILKFLTGADVTSFACKFAVDRRLMNINPDEIGLGNAIRMVLEYRTLKGKFGYVNPDLKKIGITGVDVTDEGFH